MISPARARTTSGCGSRRQPNNSLTRSDVLRCLSFYGKGLSPFRSLHTRYRSALTFLRWGSLPGHAGLAGSARCPGGPRHTHTACQQAERGSSPLALPTWRPNCFCSARRASARTRNRAGARRRTAAGRPAARRGRAGTRVVVSHLLLLGRDQRVRADRRVHHGPHGHLIVPAAAGWMPQSRTPGAGHRRTRGAGSGCSPRLPGPCLVASRSFVTSRVR